MTRLFIVRHGNTFAADEPPRRIGARTDLPLVASGMEQAHALGRWFADRGIGFARAWSGPLRRARQTAEAILSHQPEPPPLASADWLDEIDHGPDEGAGEAAVFARIGPAALAAWDRGATPPPGWIVGAAGRIAAWRALLADAPAGDTLLVTSNGAARFALLAGPPVGARPPLRLRTGALGILALQPDGAWQVPGWDVRPDAAQ